VTFAPGREISARPLLDTCSFPNYPRHRLAQGALAVLVIVLTGFSAGAGMSFGDRRHNLEIQRTFYLVEPSLGNRFCGRNNLPVSPPAAE
jgi:hypothetical protein